MGTIADSGAGENPALAILETVAEYRAAARKIATADLPLHGPDSKFVAVVELAGTLHDLGDLTLREWCREVIWRETREALWGWVAPLVEDGGRLPYEQRVRLFVREGLRDCPVCGRRFGPGIVREREIEAEAARGEAGA
jgi:hypothetical protein